MFIKISFKSLLVTSLAMMFIASSCNNGTKDTAATASTSTSGVDTASVKIAEDAFLFGYSLAIMDITRKKLTNYETPGPNGAPINQFGNKNSFPDYTFKDVVRPNADTYYSLAFCDLAKEPLVFSIPASNGRYYLMPMLDAYTNVFNSPGTRTTGDGAGNYLLTGPKWTGTVPAGITQIKAPTDIIWIAGRIKCDGKADGEKIVIPFQKKLVLTPLSAWGKPYTAPKGAVDATVPKEDPNNFIGSMPIDKFFNYVNELMVNNPPATEDKAAMDLFAKIGVAPGAKFDINKFDTATQAAMQEIPKKVYAAFDQELAKPKQLFNGWNILIKPVEPSTSGSKDVLSYRLSIASNGSATLMVTSQNRQPISFDGYVTLPEKEN